MYRSAESLGPDLNKLWLGQTASQFGSWLGALGFLAVICLDATPAQMVRLEMLRASPVLLLGPFAGLWVDRARRRPVQIWADVGRAVLLGLVVLAALSHSLRMEYLYVVGVIVGALTMFFDVAYRAYLRTLVVRERLVNANSRLSASESLAGSMPALISWYTPAAPRASLWADCWAVPSGRDRRFLLQCLV